MKAAFFTTASLGEDSGGGNASLHECNALKKFSDECDEFSSKDVPAEYRDPWSVDWRFSNLVHKSYDLVHFNGHPFERTLKSLRYYNPHIKVVSSVPAHVVESSRAEHQLLGIDYDALYPHMVNGSELWERYISQDRKADLIMYPSQMSRAYFEKQFKITAPGVVIYHGCHLPKKRPALPSLSKVTFGYIGALGVDKGVHRLLTVWESCHLGEWAKLLFFGRDSERIRRMKEDEGKKETSGGGGVDSGVRYVGVFNGLDDIMDKFHVGVYPSVSEGFNLPCLESMAYYHPVIVSDGAGASELVNEYAGTVIRARNDEDLRIAMMNYINHEKDIVEMGSEAHRIAEGHTWEMAEVAMVDEYEELMR